jgi:hypothetical protein
MHNEIRLQNKRKKENKAKYWIQNSVDDSIFSKITGASTTKQAWDILKSAYQGNDKVKTVKLQTLRTQFETLKMTELENVDQFMTRVMGIVNQIRLTGEQIEDQRIVEKVLRILLTAYSARGQLMYHEDASPNEDLMKTVLVLLGHLMLQQKFCKRNFRTPAWVNNVISLHGS